MENPLLKPQTLPEKKWGPTVCVELLRGRAVCWRMLIDGTHFYLMSNSFTLCHLEKEDKHQECKDNKHQALDSIWQEGNSTGYGRIANELEEVKAQKEANVGKKCRMFVKNHFRITTATFTPTIVPQHLLDTHSEQCKNSHYYIFFFLTMPQISHQKWIGSSFFFTLFFLL